MKMKILVLLVLFISSNAISQKDCKPAATAIAKTTGQLYSYYGDQMTPGVGPLVSKGIEYSAKIYIVNDTAEKVTYLQVVTLIPSVPYNYLDNGEEWFPPGTTVELYLENDEKLFFQSTETSFTKNHGNNYTAAQFAHINDEQIALLCSLKIVKYIIMPFLDIEKLPLSYKVNSKIGQKLKTQFNCYRETGYENNGKVSNPRKAETYMKLADKYLMSNEYEKAKNYYAKSIDQSNDLVVLTKLNILNVFLQHETQANMQELEKNIMGIKKANNKEENIGLLEEMTLFLFEQNIEMIELEEILMLLAN